ncbi:hypothetical protein BaRGS_00004499 [Batillaria attramentaria]|uniref:Uncharacterized protein n=1 Tax=Batillaria attramentaria TaxID=370345 RepID=A0ABD0LYE1_9CAEN
MSTGLKRKKSENEQSSELLKRKQTARERWRILAEVKEVDAVHQEVRVQFMARQGPLVYWDRLDESWETFQSFQDNSRRTLKGRCTSETQQSAVSVRRFQTFGLLKTQKAEMHLVDGEEASWYRYYFSALPDITVTIRCLAIRGGDDTLLSATLEGIQGHAWIFAPSRNKTFAKFCDLAKDLFQLKQLEQYDDCVWNSHLQMKNRSPAYDKDLHYPLFVQLTKPSSQQKDSRDTTPESR